MPGSHRWSQRWVETINFLKEVYMRFGEDRIALSAGAIAFFTLLSLVPLLLLAVTFAAPQITVLLDSLQSTLGETLYVFLKEQVTNLTQLTGVSVTVALVFGFWSGGQIFLILESAMNLAWHAQKKRPLWLRRVLAFIMVLFIGVIVFGAILLINLVRFLSGLDITLWGYNADQLSWLYVFMLTVVIPILLISAVFAVIYRVLPSKQVTVRAVIPGALFAGTLWLVSLHLFSWYANYVFSRFFALYGSLTSIFLLMVLFYYDALILLLGSEISVVYHRRLVMAGNRTERLVEETDQLSEEARENARERARLEDAARRITYYGYQGEEWRVIESRDAENRVNRVER